MKRDRLARQIGITSAKEVKRPGNKRYRGGSDPNKGHQKRMWYECICSICGKRNKVEFFSKSKCSCAKS